MEHAVLWAVNANWNADNGGWNVEANSVENPNRWNDGNQVLSRYSCLSPLFFGGVLLSKPRFQPPIMRPTSSTSFPKAIYLSFAINDDSHANCRKNRSASAFIIASTSRGIFACPLA